MIQLFENSDVHVLSLVSAEELLRVARYYDIRCKPEDATRKSCVSADGRTFVPQYIDHTNTLRDGICARASLSTDEAVYLQAFHFASCIRPWPEHARIRIQYLPRISLANLKHNAAEGTADSTRRCHVCMVRAARIELGPAALPKQF